MDPNAATSLLNALSKLPRPTERPQTFMEIGGYAHFENICSNFLAFFLDPEGVHGLGELFLDALLDSVDVLDRQRGVLGNVPVAREVVTEAGNRIDILLRRDPYAVLIENKIFAAVNNPFDDYAAYLERLRNEDGVPYENKVKILLTLHPSGEGRKQGFVNLTYGDFVGTLRGALGRHVLRAQPRYLPLLLDFLSTLENLGEGTRMNPEYIKVLADRSGEVDDFLHEVNKIRVELRRKIQELEALISLEGHQNVTHIPWKPGVSLVHFLQTRVDAGEKSFVGVETGVSPSGWEIRLFSRGHGAPSGLELEELLRRLDIKFEDREALFYATSFDYGEDVGSIVVAVEEIAGKISGALHPS